MDGSRAELFPLMVVEASSAAMPGEARGAVAFRCTADCDAFGRLPPCWLAPGEFDDRHLGEQIRGLLERDPDVRLVADITTCSPAWWDADHPDELVIWDDGGSNRELGQGCIKTGVPSLASDLWARTMRENLMRLVRRMEQLAGPGRLAGCVVGSGMRDTWIHFGTAEGYLFDYNDRMTPRFRSWLRRRYGDDRALGAAWGRNVTVANAELPTPDERYVVDGRGLRHPVEQRNVIDHGLFMADLTASAVAHAAAAVKEATAGRAAFGVRYGNFLEPLQVQDGLQQSGQLGFRQVLGNEQVDFLLAPAMPPGFSSAPAASVALRGKRLYHEVRNGDRCALQFALTHGLGLWCQAGFEPGAPPVAIRRDRADVAMVLDDHSMFYVRRPPLQFTQVITQQLVELSKLEIPIDTVMLADILEGAPYRVLLFPNLLFADERLREAIHSRLAEHHCTAIWLLGAGFVDRDARFRNAESLVGMRIRKPEKPHAAMIRADSEHGMLEYGCAEMVGHYPIIADPACEILGVYTQSGLPGLGSKEQEGWTAVFSGAPAVSAELLRRFVRHAGLSDEKRGRS